MIKRSTSVLTDKAIKKEIVIGDMKNLVKIMRNCRQHLNIIEIDHSKHYSIPTAGILTKFNFQSGEHLANDKDLLFKVSRFIKAETYMSNLALLHSSCVWFYEQNFVLSGQGANFSTFFYDRVGPRWAVRTPVVEKLTPCPTVT